MQIVFHIGAHCTDADRLVRSLLRNREVLATHGVAVPGPGRYRKTLSEALVRLRGAQASPEAQDVLLEAVIDDERAHRLILSNESFISMPTKVIEGGAFYPKAGKSTWLRNAFPGAEVEFALGIRSFSSFLPALYDLLGPDQTAPESFLAGIEPLDLLWSDYIGRIATANPGAPILVWCDEDSPLIWPEIMRELAAVDASVPLKGALDLSRQIMAPEGHKRLRGYLRTRPPDNENIRRKVVAAFLTKYALTDEIEQDVALPGWNQELIEALDARYDEDMERIAAIPGVTLIAP